MKQYLFLLLFLLPLMLLAQVRPDQFPEETNPNDSNFEMYSQKGGVNKRASMSNLRKYFAGRIISQVNPPAASGNSELIRNTIVDVVSDNSLWFVDWQGFAVKVNRGDVQIYKLDVLADTSTISDPIVGDFVYVDNDTTAIYSIAGWLVSTNEAQTDGVTLLGNGSVNNKLRADTFNLVTARRLDSILANLVLPIQDVSIARVYCPGHGIDLDDYVGNVASIRINCSLANSQHIDSIQTVYIVATPDSDSLDLQASGLVYRPEHELEGLVYYLQDDGNNGTDLGTVPSKVFVVVDSNYINLVDPSTISEGQSGYIPIVRLLPPAFSIYGTDYKVPNDTAVQNLAEFYDSLGLVIPGSLFAAYDAGISDNITYRRNSDGSSSPAHLYQWNGQVLTRMNRLPVSINMQDTLYGGSGLLDLTPVMMAGDLPTGPEAYSWLETNYTDNGLRLPNGSLIYVKGEGTEYNPDWIAMIIDDISYNRDGSTTWERLLKILKEPVWLKTKLQGGNDVAINSSNTLNIGNAATLSFIQQNGTIQGKAVNTAINGGTKTGNGLILYENGANFSASNGLDIIGSNSLLSIVQPASGGLSDNWPLGIIDNANGRVAFVVGSGNSLYTKHTTTANGYKNENVLLGYGGFAGRNANSNEFAGFYTRGINLYSIGRISNYTTASSNTAPWMTFDRATSRIGVLTTTPAVDFDVNGTTRIRAGEIQLDNGGTLKIKTGTGDPNSVYTAIEGSFYLQTDAPGMFLKTGPGSTGWENQLWIGYRLASADVSITSNNDINLTNSTGNVLRLETDFFGQTRLHANDFQAVRTIAAGTEYSNSFGGDVNMNYHNITGQILEINTFEDSNVGTTWITGRGREGTGLSVVDSIQADDILFNWFFRGTKASGSPSWGTAAMMRVVATESYTPTSHGGRFDFYTTPNGSDTNEKRFTIDQDGSILADSYDAGGPMVDPSQQAAAEWGTDGRLRRVEKRVGTATIEGDGDGEQSVTVTFAAAMPDNVYNIQLSISGTTGTLEITEKIMQSGSKTTGGFTITLHEAIEIGETIIIDWSVIDQ
jgi:hypothetical protein